MQLTRTARLSSKRTLALMGAEGASMHPLPELGLVTVGSAAPCNIVVADPEIAAHHLSLQITPSGIEIVDQGSKTGTRIGAVALEPRRPTPLLEGVSVTLGSTVFFVQQTQTSARPRRLLTHGYFEARVDEECARASRGGAPFAIIRARAKDGESGEKIAELLGSWTRSLDIIGVYAPGRYEVLLAQTDEKRAELIGKQIQASFDAQGVAVVVEVCCYPRDGRSAEVLVDRGPFRDESGTAAHDKLQTSDSTTGNDGSYAARIHKMVSRIAAGEISVLILGETGVGKEVMAHRIHALSRRSSKGFVALNCSAIAESLLESELFGHEKGAFTGATQAKPGLLESVDGGTVFLDEIGEMPMSIQAKLLRVIEQREITRVGALKPRPIDVRFLSATNRDLEREIEAGRFRQDLYFRLNGIALSIPPLRERPNEIVALAETFLRDAARRMGKAPSGVSAEALALLQTYAWPGNIRELRNMIERAVLLSDGEAILPEHLPTEKMRAVVPAAVPRYVDESAAVRAGSVDSLSTTSPAEVPRAADPEPESRREVGIKVRRSSDEERRRIIAALERSNGNQTAAALLLGISRRTLVSRLSALDLPRPRKRG